MSLYSWDYPNDDGVPGWFRRARAYIDASRHLFGALEGGTLPRTYHHAQVAAFVFAQSIENFLKGAIVAAGSPFGRSHSLSRLYGVYKAAFPNPEYRFTGAIDDPARDDAWPPNEFLRYPVDNDGQPWFGQSHFDLSVWTEQVRRFDHDYRRLEPLLTSHAQRATS